MHINGGTINNSIELKHRIMQLHAKKAEQEEMIKRGVKELAYMIHPVSVLKNSLTGLAKDTEVKQDVRKLGLEAGANYLIGKLFSKNSSLKGYLASFVVQRLATTLIRRNPQAIFSGLGKLGKMLKLT
jgi:hypothetical protein